MEQFGQIIGAIRVAEDYPEQLDNISVLITDETGAPHKPKVKELIQAMSKIITSDDRPPLTKFYTIMIAKQFTARKIGVFISSLASSQLLQDMVKIAKQVDSQKKMPEKGLNLFLGNREIGNRFVTLVLECIVMWSQRFPSTSTKQTSKFKLAYEQLVAKKVVLPQDFMYFETSSRQDSRVRQSQVMKETPQPKQTAPDKDADTHLRHSLSKIEGLYTLIVSSKDEEQLLRESIKYHKFFQEDVKKMQANLNQYMETMNENSVGILLEVIEFYHNEGEAYRRSIEERKDIKAYINSTGMHLEGLSQHFSKPIQNRRVAESTKSIPIQKPPKPSEIRNSKTTALKADKPSAESQIRKTDSQQRQIRQDHQESKSPYNQPQPYRSVDNQRRNSANNSQIQNNIYQLEKQAEEGEQHIKTLLNVSSAGGGFALFKSIFKVNAAELQREKGPSSSHYHSKLTKNRQRSHTPVSHYRSKSKNEEHFNSLSQSKVSVFELFPDAVVSRTEYAGRIVPMQLNYSQQLQEMSEAQGIRRFKVSNFKEKSLLLENSTIQVGFKSTAHYDRINSFKQCLKITMFFGNKSEVQMTHLGVEFQGDKTCIIYANPVKIDPTVEPGYQAKQQLLVIPLQMPFSLINMKIKFTLNREITRLNLFLPTSVMKFVTLKKMEVADFQRNYSSLKRNALRTIAFRLSRNIPPNTLRRYLSQMTEMNDYQQFITQTSKTYMEYKLCSAVSVMNLHDYLLKIRVRPDMSVIIQLVPRTAEQSAIEMGYFVVQTLQFLLEKQN